MKNQPDINEKMRAILIDWLVEVHLKFKLYPETLYLTINLIDRYLEKDLEDAKLELKLINKKRMESTIEKNNLILDLCINLQKDLKSSNLYYKS